MQTYTWQEALKNKKELFEQLENKAIFIYPTDTIYGIGCDATNSKAVKQIRKIKEREDKPFSIIAPNFEWINKNCNTSKAKKWLAKLPGPYTLILPLKKTKVVCEETNNESKSLGVRIPNHWIADFVKEYGRPIITTSVNKTGEKSCNTLKELEKFSVDFIIYEGEKKGKPSTVIDLRNEEKIVR